MNAARHILALAEPNAPIGDDCAVVPLAELAPRKGETIAAFVERAGWDVDLMPTVCRVGKSYYAREEWAGRKIRANDNVLFIARPAGGGGGAGGGQGKAIGAAVAMIALAVLAPYAAPFIAGAAGLGGSTLATSLISTALIAGGSMLLSHFLQPKAATPSDKSPDLYTFQFGGNAARPQQVVPVNYGKRLTYPDFASMTYSEYDGDEMIDYGLYCIGCGQYEINELRLSDTVIWTKDGGFTGSFAGALTMQHVEPGDDVTLFPVNVVTSTEVAGTQMSANIVENGIDDAVIGPFAANAAGTNATELILDFIFPSGLYYQPQSTVLSNGVQVNIYITPIDAAGAQSGATVLETVVFQAAKNSQLRFTERYAVAPGRYEVAVARLNAENSLQGSVDSLVWSALRAHIEGPQRFEGVTTLALKAKADNGLQTLAGGRVGVVATRILPVFTEDGWVEQPTRSIAWAAFDAWTNEDYSAGLPSEGVDLTNLATYDAFWTEAEHTFDHSFTESSSVIEALETILKAGRAVPAVLGDTLSIMRDEDRGLPAMVFTDREIVRGSLNIDYTLYNSALADGVVGSYLDETTWRVAEVSSAPDDVVLVNPARVELTGVTKRAQAAGLVRFQAGESTYRRTQVTFQIEAEGRLIRRGMAIAVQSELPQQWGDGGEILSISTYSLTLDHVPPWTGSDYIELRGPDGVYWGPVAVTQGGSPNIAVISTSEAGAMVTQTGRTLESILTRSSGQDKPTYVFGTADKRAFRCLVKEGTPSGDLLTLVAVNDDERVYAVVETGVDPMTTAPAWLTDKDPPIITQLAAKMKQDGTYARLTAGWKAAKNALNYEAAISYDAGTTWAEIYSGTKTALSAVVNPADLLLRVRGISPAKVAGAWSQTTVPGITLVINTANIDIEIDFDAIVGEAEAQMKLISGKGQGSIDELRKRVFKLSEEIANTAATQAGHSYEQRNLIKVTLTEEVNKAFAAINTETVARISATEALASITTTLAVRLGSAESQLTTEQTVRATADQALAQLVTELQSRLTTAETGLLVEATARQTLTTLVNTQGTSISSLSTNYTGLNSRLTNAEGTITNQATAVSQLQSGVTTINGQISTQATSLTALGSTVGSQNATLTQYGASIDGIKVQYAVVGTIDGVTGGFILQGVRKMDGSVSFNMVLQGDLLVDGTISARKIVDLSLGSNKLAAGAVTAGVAFGAGGGAASSSILVGAGGSVVLICQMTQVAFSPPNSGGSIAGYVNNNQVVSSPLSRVWLGDATQFWPQCFVGVWQSPFGFDTVVGVGCTVDPAFACTVTALGFKR